MVIALLLGLLLLPAAAAAADAGPAPPAEYEVKAAFLYNFARFVEWPAGAGAMEDSFVITILGEDPFGGVLDDMLDGKVVDGRRVVVHRTHRADEVRDSRILFISDSEQPHLPAILKRLEGAATLTVGEMDRFAERGGVIRFRTERSRVRLEINLAVAERARLKISSELLKLARIVGEEASD